MDHASTFLQRTSYARCVFITSIKETNVSLRDALLLCIVYGRNCIYLNQQFHIYVIKYNRTIISQINIINTDISIIGTSYNNYYTLYRRHSCTVHQNYTYVAHVYARLQLQSFSKHPCISYCSYAAETNTVCMYYVIMRENNRDGCHMCGRKYSLFLEHLIALPLGSSWFHPFIGWNLAVLGLHA